MRWGVVTPVDDYWGQKDRGARVRTSEDGTAEFNHDVT